MVTRSGRLRRRLGAAILAVAVLLLPWPAAADVFLPLSPFVLEMWDANGVFHMVDVQLTVAFPAPSKLNKSVSSKIQQALQTLPYRELTKPTGADTLKSMALGIIRAQPEGADAEDVLIQKLMFR